VGRKCKTEEKLETRKLMLKCENFFAGEAVENPRNSKIDVEVREFFVGKAVENPRNSKLETRKLMLKCEKFLRAILLPILMRVSAV
jgi:hypothetical protein